MEYDLAVVGAGAAGLGAAREGIRRGARTLLVEADRLGGDCTWTGCVPSKTLVAAAARGDGFGAAMAAVRATVERVAATEDEPALRAEGIEVAIGQARFRDPHRLEVVGRRVEARRVVVATGAEPTVPDVPGLSEIDPLTSDTVFDLGVAPRSLVVVGGGAVGCELAQVLARLGVAVTVVEMLDHLLPGEEPEASEVIEAVFAGEGIDVRAGWAVERAEASPAGARLGLASGEAVEAERVLVATGRRPVTAALDLDRAGVQVGPAGFVRVDRHLATTARSVYAAGDVTGIMGFTHAADEMGRLAAANALSRRRRSFDVGVVPVVTFTDPEVARVGVREQEAGRRARVAYLPMGEVDRAVVAGQERGFVKLIATPRWASGNLGGGRLAGATVVAPRAGEMIHEAALAMRTRMFTGRLVQTVHAYPTWSLAMRQAAAQFFFEVGGRRARPARSGASSPRYSR